MFSLYHIFAPLREDVFPASRLHSLFSRLPSPVFPNNDNKENLTPYFPAFILLINSTANQLISFFTPHPSLLTFPPAHQLLFSFLLTPHPSLYSHQLISLSAFLLLTPHSSLSHQLISSSAHQLLFSLPLTPHPSLYSHQLISLSAFLLLTPALSHQLISSSASVFPNPF